MSLLYIKMGLYRCVPISTHDWLSQVCHRPHLLLPNPALIPSFLHSWGLSHHSLRCCDFFFPTDFAFSRHLDWIPLFLCSNSRLHPLPYGLNKVHLAVQTPNIIQYIKTDTSKPLYSVLAHPSCKLLVFTRNPISLPTILPIAIFLRHSISCVLDSSNTNSQTYSN